MKTKIRTIILLLFCALFTVTACGKSGNEEFLDKYVGMWMDSSEKSCLMSVKCEDGKNFIIDIYWSEDNDMHMVLDGEYDSKKGGLAYTGSKISEIYGDDGELEEVMEYDDATGLIYFGQDGSLYWDDEKEKLGKGCVFVRADEEKTDDESDSQGNDINNEGYAGIWLSQPSGQEGYNIYAEGIWIKSYTDTNVEYETAYFIGKPINSTGFVCKDYTWEIDRHTSGTAEIVDSDIEGIKCFFADDENVYLASDKLYYGEYLDEDLGLIKTGFQSLDFCIYYYNCDYGYCYNNVDYPILDKHGINNDFLKDEYWYLHFKKFVNGNESIQLEISDMWNPEITLAVQHYADEMSPDTLWYFDLSYDKKGKNEELIYVPEKNFWTDYEYTLYYYPEDCHIYIETEDSSIAGEYQFEGEYSRDEWMEFAEQNVKDVKLPENSMIDNGNIGKNDSSDISPEYDTLAGVDELWFITYHTFTKEGTEDVLRITAMNDALLYVEFDGADGDWGEWDFNTQYDEIGKDGELIYYYGKDFVMSYYPNEHRIHIETSNDIYQGDYICTNI